MTDVMNVFDRRAVRRQRDRAAPGLAAHDFLFREVAERLVERLDDVRRDFPLALDLGCHGGHLAAALQGRRGIEQLIQCDLSPAMARTARANNRPTLVADEEWLPFAPRTFDLVVSGLSLHWVNDLPGALVQIKQCLKPDGLFLGAILGGETLQELRIALIEAESDLGTAPRVSPFAELRDAGGLLQRAGFALPVADLDRITVSYASALALVQELRGMGESHAGHNRRPLRRGTLLRAAEIYAEKFGQADGRVAATFDVLTLTGWAPDATQPRALRPGSAAQRLAEALDSEEVSSGEKADPE